ncbi:RNA polymerase II-associated factor 1 homolog [Halichondria panicea]|uniref:RNA polymerase II-associated factor 1 homolog n=1 Tax=Halichondria panicea TaxID=6063 RepID=UPI00312B5A8D
MPTTVETAQKKKSHKPSGSKNLDLLCSVKYKNTLPDIPFDAKFLSYPFDSQRFIQYNPTSLERSHKHDLLTEVDLGVPIDLILPDTYPSHGLDAVLDPADEALLEDEVVQQPESKRAKQHAKSVSWLRRTEYISTEFARPHSAADGAETKVGYNVKKKLQGMDVYKDRASQIAAIEATFEAAKQPITKHYSKRGVEAKEVLPLFPDFELWKLPFAQVLYDTDPANSGRPEQKQVEEMSQAMIRGMMDENNEQFVAYFLPTPDTLVKRREDNQLGLDYQDEAEYEYKLTKEYNWNVKNKASKGYEETYFFVTRPEQGVFYNEIETRVRLSKRRGKSAKSAMNSKLVVKHRELVEDEVMAQESRLTQLEAAVPEEDWEEAASEEETEGGDDDGSEGTEEEAENQNDFEQAFGSGEDDD